MDLISKNVAANVVKSAHLYRDKRFDTLKGDCVVNMTNMKQCRKAIKFLDGFIWFDKKISAQLSEQTEMYNKRE